MWLLCFNRCSSLESGCCPEPIDGEENWVVRAIVDSRKNNRKKRKPTKYLVLWEGYPDEEATWEPYENIKGTADEALEEFKKKNPKAVWIVVYR